MNNTKITEGIATSTTCHVTMIIITTVAATSMVPEITKVIINGMSKSKMQRSDEAYIIHSAQTQNANLQ
jgi:hypothetical protein